MTADLDLYSGLPKLGNSLAVWADDARQAATVARSLAPTPFVPQSLRAVRADRDETDDSIHARTAANITAAILTGAELGLTPMAALRSIVVIQGTPAMTAVALRGLVQSAGHDVWIESSSDARVVACGRRRGSEQVERSVWTMDRARQLGLTGKDNWKKQPESMLVARATSEVARRIAADVLLGMPYSVEELRDDTVETEPQRTARRRAAKEPAPMPEPPLEEARQEPTAPPEPPLDEPTASGDDGNTGTTQMVAERAEDPITPKQLTALNAALSSDLGFTDREDKLAYLSGELGREIGSSKDVTKSEAMRLLDGFAAERQPAEPPLDESWPAVPEPGGAA